MSGPERTVLYRLFDARGELLYVGISGNVGRRLAQHDRTKDWAGRISHVAVEHHVTRSSAQAAERLAIRTEQPRFNKWRPRAATGLFEPLVLGDVDGERLVIDDADTIWELVASFQAWLEVHDASDAAGGFRSLWAECTSRLAAALANGWIPPTLRLPV